MRNRFFLFALRHAASLMSKRPRLFLLLAQLSNKMRTVNWKNISIPTVSDKFHILARFIKAYARGHYREVPWKSMTILVAAILYFISPLDLIPDFIPLTGLTDDIGVLLWVFNSLNKEIEKFLAWERFQLTSL